MTEVFDAIVVGSGITGGWAAKELTERGLKTLLIERGPMIEHQTDYKTETTAPWDLEFRGYGDPTLFESDYAVQSKGRYFNEWTSAHFTNDRLNPYQNGGKFPFQWRRGYQLGGRSLLWGRQCYRWSDLDFGANAADNHGEDWPLRYADVAPWYDHVERFIGVSGSREGLYQLPDSIFQRPMEMNAVEKALKGRLEQQYRTRKLIIGRSANLTEAHDGRGPCQNRNICARGCSYGAYFSTQSSTLPAARATGNLTLMTDSAVDSLIHDPATGRAVGVRVIDATNRKRSEHRARIVFLCAGSVNSVSLLLRSRGASAPNGLANSSGVLGQYFMDHALTTSVVARIPGFDDRTYFGNRANGIVIPRFVNATEPAPDLLRGYSYQGMAFRTGWSRGVAEAGIGADFKKANRAPGPWYMLLGAFAECLPRKENQIGLAKDGATDSLGIIQTRIDFDYSDNERKLIQHAHDEALKMVSLIGGEVVTQSAEIGASGAVHEMGGARMGRNPQTSVLNAHSQAHDVPNLFVTDGAQMNSSACQNPSLTYMALTARAAAFAVDQLKSGQL